MPTDAPQPASALFELASGAMMTLTGDPCDISVFGYVRAYGKWESHIAAAMSEIVPPNGVCLDAGANIGCHTLHLASIIPEGLVWAVEASSTNFAFLERNVAALPAPHAGVRCLNCAVWSEPGEIVISTVDQVAGCSFVSRSSSLEESEALVRAQVAEEALRGRKLDIHLDRVPAITLDQWAEEQDLQRLDLVKMDIEGSERQALLGARTMLRRFDPALVIEYNPACAELYWGEPPELLFETLATLFADIRVIGVAGLGEPVADWNALAAALADGGLGWADLCCRGARG